METQKNTKKPIDYSKSKIYKIVCDTTGLIYIGSTIQKLCERLRGHKAKYKGYLKGKYPFVTSFDILKNNNYKIILIENCPCNSKEELEREERQYIESIECVNKNIPGRTDKEYYETYKDKIKENYKNNKDKINEKHKKYYEDNKDKIREKNKEYQIEYYQNNKDKIREKNKEYQIEYYQNNKDKISEKYKIKIKCEYCKSLITKLQLKRHQKTNKCLKLRT